MANSIHYAAAYKNKIINLLLANKDFIKLINPEPSECNELDIVDVLIGGEWVINGKKWQEQGHVFDHDFVDDTVVEQKTFVFVEADIDYIDRGMFSDFTLYICLFTAKELVRLTDESVPTPKEVKEMGCFASTTANRIDALGEVIDRTINGNKRIPGIGTVTPARQSYWKRYYPNNKYYGRSLAYNISNLCEDDFDGCGDF